MLERIGLFRKGDISLRVLIADIEFLINALEAIDANVRRQLRSHWEVLEEVYSVALAMNGGNLDARAESLILDSIIALRARISELLGQARC